MSKHRNEMFGVRPLKNFLWWLFGFISPIILLIASIVVGLFVIPVSKYLEWAGVSEEETETYVSKEISNGTVFDGLTGITEYTMEDVPVLLDLLSMLSDELSGVTINEQPLFKVDKEKLQQLKTSKVIDIQNIFTTYTSCVSVVATINSLGLDLGEFNQLSAIGSFDLIEQDEQLATYFTDGTVPEIPQMYYYDVSQLQGNSQPKVSVQSESPEDTQESAPQNYARVFKDDGSLVDELSGLSAEQLTGLNFYYPALNSVPVIDFIKVFPERFKMTTLSSILEVFSDNTEDGALNKILGDETIGSIGGLGFDSFMLVDFIDEPTEENEYANKELYDILKDATGKENNKDITLQDLSSNMDINQIRLVSIIDEPTEENGYTNKDLYDILKDATGKENNDEITISDLSSGMNIDNIRLATIIDAPTVEDPEKNKELYDMLKDATGKSENDKITVGDLSSSMNIDSIRLTSIIDEPTEENEYKNKDLYDILKDATGKSENAEITVGDLSSSMSIDNIRLTTIIDAPSDEYPDKNKELYDMLKDATGKSENDKITVGDLSSSMNIDSIRLASIIEAPSDYLPKEGEEDYDQKLEAYNKNRKLYDILLDSANANLEENEEAKTYGDITVGSLSEMNMDAICLVSIIDAPSENEPEKNKDLYNILKDATGVDSYDKITVGSLSEMEIDRVRLTNILEAPSDYLPTEGEEGYDQKLDAYNRNRDLYKVLKDVTNAETYDEITVGSLSNMDMDNVHLTSIIDAPSDTNPETNKDLYSILRDLTEKSNEEITIKDLSGIDINKVHLSSILEVPASEKPTDTTDPEYNKKLEAYNKNRKLYDILLDSTEAKKYEDITVGMLSDLKTDNIHLARVIDVPTADNGYKNKDLYKILLDTTADAETYEDITIGMISDMKIDNVHLSSIIAPPTSDVKVEKPTDVTDPEYQQKLDQYDAYHKNRDLYNILRDLTNKPNDEIVVGDLSNIDMNNVHLSSILEAPSDNNSFANKKLYDILLNSTEAKTYGDITVGMLSDLNTENILLSNILDVPTENNKYKNEDIYKILKDVTGEEYNEITVSSLSDIEIKNIHLSNILEVPTENNGFANQKIYDILLDSANANRKDGEEEKTYGTLRVADFNNFNIDAVKLSTVMGVGENKIINTLLNDKENPVTLGNIGDRINNLSVEEVYGIECFTTDTNKARDDATAYYKTTKETNEEGETVYITVYTTEKPDGYKGKTYYISAEAKVWLFLLYKADGVNYVSTENPDGTGVAKTYTAVDFTIGGMNDRIVNVSGEIMSATIRQAYDCGILESKYEKIWGLSFTGVIEKLNETLSKNS